MAPFPCPSERAAASALLLLTVTPPPPPKVSCVDINDDESSVRTERISKSGSRTNFRDQSLVSGGDSKSCCTSVLAAGSYDVSSDEIQALKIKMISLEALHRDVKLKAMQRSRSKIGRSVKFNSWKTSSGVKVAMTTSFASKSSESSCLSSSSSSSAASSARSRYESLAAAGRWGSSSLAAVVDRSMKLKKKKRMKMMNKPIGSAKLRRKAEAILELLSQGCYSEIKIRQTLGDSPDTSKALRLLLKIDEVKRFGTGGRRSPFIYTIA